MVDYVRGLGGYTLTAAELTDLRRVLSAATTAFEKTPSATGLGRDIYNIILSSIQVVTTNYDPGQTITKPAPGVSPDVYAWIEGASGVNGDSTFAGAFIRKYTVDQLLIREGTRISQDLAVSTAAEASNRIALKVAQDIVDHEGQLPGIAGLGAIDAGSAASTVFTLGGHQADYAGWAGTLLFPYIGEPDFYKDWLLSDQAVSGTVPSATGIGQDSVVFKHYAGTYDLVASIEAAGQASTQALAEYPVHGSYQGLFGPSGATQTNQNGLIDATNKFFANYYSLSSNSHFLPGNDLIFANLSN